MSICVDRCVCTRRTFRSLLDEAKERSLSLDQLCERTGASRSCGMCGPYLERAFRTGEDVFHELLPAPESSPCGNS